MWKDLEANDHYEWALSETKKTLRKYSPVEGVITNFLQKTSHKIVCLWIACLTCCCCCVAVPSTVMYALFTCLLHFIDWQVRLTACSATTNLEVVTSETLISFMKWGDAFQESSRVIFSRTFNMRLTSFEELRQDILLYFTFHFFLLLGFLVTGGVIIQF